MMEVTEKVRNASRSEQVTIGPMNEVGREDLLIIEYGLEKTLKKNVDGDFILHFELCAKNQVRRRWWSNGMSYKYIVMVYV